jgi:hypothetical protein
MNNSTAAYVVFCSLKKKIYNKNSIFSKISVINILKREKKMLFTPPSQVFLKIRISRNIKGSSSSSRRGERKEKKQK